MSARLVDDLNRMHSGDDLPAAPRMGSNLRHIPPAPAWARKTIAEFDQNLARARSWHRKLLAEGADWDAVARAQHEVTKAEAQWDNVVTIAIQRRVAEFNEIVLPMLEKLAAQWAAAEDRRQKKMGRLLEALNEVRKEEGTQQALYGQMLALHKPYGDVVPNDFDSPTQYGDNLGGLRVGTIAMTHRWGTDLQHTSGVFEWPTPPVTPPPPAPLDCVDRHGTSRQRHVISYVAGRNNLERSFWQCAACGKEWAPETWPIPQSAA